MKRFFLFILILFLPVLLYAQPSIEFNKETHDFGNVKQGDIIEHIFDFVNTGDEDLIINKIVTS